MGEASAVDLLATLAVDVVIASGLVGLGCATVASRCELSVIVTFVGLGALMAIA